MAPIAFRFVTADKASFNAEDFAVSAYFLMIKQ